MERNRIESGARTVEEAKYKGWRIRVVAGYSIERDEFLSHLYVGQPGEPAQKVYDHPKSETTLEDALDAGFAHGVAWVDELKPLADG